MGDPKNIGNQLGNIKFGGGAFGGSPLNDVAGDAFTNVPKMADQQEPIRQQADLLRRDAEGKQRSQLEAKRRDEANKAYQSGQASLAQSTADEDAFTQARNAARRAKGTQLFGSWG